MLFNSIEFALFFPIVFILYWFIFNKTLKMQNFFVLCISYIFYGWWSWKFLILIALTTLFSYYSGLAIKANENNRKHCMRINAFNIIFNLIILGIFKYYNFFASSLADAFSSFGVDLGDVTLKLILPVGISFYTFQALSYSIDIYYKKIEPTKDIVAFFAFVSFFPQLVAGPIERASNLLPQFEKERFFSYEKSISAMNLIIYGLFKKMVVADRLAVYVDNVYNNLDGANSVSIFLAVIFFTFQIYCDFSGYTDIARGIARLLGFELMKNFDRPYLAKSIPEFWRRWHISLSTWFKDYLYIPLGGSRCSSRKRYRNLLTVFLISGLWHGANWTFIIWGGLHGFYQVFGVSTAKFRNNIIGKLNLPKQLLNIYNIFITFCLVSFAWIFFRAASFKESMIVVRKLFAFDISTNLSEICAGAGPLNLLLSIIVILILLATYLFPKDLNMTKNTSLSFMSILTLIIIFISKSGYAEFIYFQF